MSNSIATFSWHRVSREEVLFLPCIAQILRLGDLANEIRLRKNPNPWVTRVLDANQNSANICSVVWISWAFYRHQVEVAA